MYRRRSFFWYVIGAVFFIAAGVTALLGVVSPYALPIILMIVGVVVIISGFFRILPSAPALAIFIIGAIVLAFTASGLFGPFQSTTETFELTRTQVPNIDGITLLGKVSTGNVRLSFTSNNTILYRIVFTKYFNIFFKTTANVTRQVQNSELIVNATSTTASLDITINQNLRNSYNLTTSTGNISLEASTAVTRMRRATLTTTTGNVWFNITNTFSLERIIAKTTTGQVEAHIKSSSQSQNAVVQLTTVTGNVRLSLNITGIASKIIASTTTGTVNTDLTGFVIINESRTNVNAQTPDYNSSALRKIDATATTTTGNVDITAHRT